MPSPFPGMNPYLEQEDVWDDFHTSLLVAIRTTLASQLRGRYIALNERRIYISSSFDIESSYRPSRVVQVTAPFATNARFAYDKTDSPARVRLPIADVERSAFVAICDAESRELVTAIELIRPAQKRSGDHRQQYLAKRNEVFHSGASLVEIDLLRGGMRMPMRNLPACEYSAVISRFEDRPHADAWPISLCDQLPTIPIPLHWPGETVPLNLQECLQRVYDDAGYVNHIYDSFPEPPLSTEDAAWAEGILKQHGA